MGLHGLLLLRLGVVERRNRPADLRGHDYGSRHGDCVNIAVVGKGSGGIERVTERRPGACPGIPVAVSVLGTGRNRKPHPRWKSVRVHAGKYSAVRKKISSLRYRQSSTELFLRFSDARV